MAEILLLYSILLYVGLMSDAEYPQCPKCGEKMMFVGQVSMEDLEEYGEGIYYGFICNECKIAATGYQQT
ncbi:DUF1963 domain-containing protein [Clostridium sp. ZBS13]|uniref:DUF1963 domain-containing protein n=1 Tax=Clostridium sp. ZBS13 TaxID=2949971 RepID=UPI00207A2FDC|nr:DUF1963 domain-containing protein [Clostridium sp. ZBS13]